MRPPSDLPSRRPRVRRFQISSKWRIALAVVAVLLVVLILSAKSLASFYVDAIWFRSVDHSEVFWGVLRAKLFLVVGSTLLFAVIAYVSLSIADRVAPSVRAPKSSSSATTTPPTHGTGCKTKVPHGILMMLC